MYSRDDTLVKATTPRRERSRGIHPRAGFNRVDVCMKPTPFPLDGVRFGVTPNTSQHNRNLHCLSFS